MQRKGPSKPQGTFDPSFHYEMLSDYHRVEPFRRAIEALVKPDDVVIDLGTGTGLMAILAARAGARRVYAVEKMGNIRAVAEANFRAEGNLALQLPILDTDIANVEFPETVDVVICEMLQTWLVEEQQILALNNAHRFLNPGARLIPGMIVNQFAVVQTALDYAGATIGLPCNNNINAIQPILLSNTVTFSTVDLHQPQALEVVAKPITIEIQIPGMANAICINSFAIMDDGTTVGNCPTLFSQYIVPAVTPLQVTRGGRLHITIAYAYACRWNEMIIHFE
jgi:predicted RNA methylase